MKLISKLFSSEKIQFLLENEQKMARYQLSGNFTWHCR